jgi:2-amino-4-hydroxy-6-hydroxymethyldihydropteridine diphosphokinase
VRYWIGLGSNLGDRLTSLRQAALALTHAGSLLARSRIFATSPVGGPPQPPFLNAALLLETSLSPDELLLLCHEIERALGRAREAEIRWGPRTIDLDLLLAGPRGEQLFRSPLVELPHPRLHERAFALVPLLDLDPTLIHPISRRPLSSLLSGAIDAGQAPEPTSDLL